MHRVGLFAIAASLAVQIQASEVDGQTLAERVTSLRSELAAMEPAAPLDPVGSGLSLAKLHLERAERIMMGESHDPYLTTEGELQAALRALEWYRAGQPPYPDTYGETLTLAYEADSDGSCQPYWVYVPSSYDASRAWPVIVYLHGWVPQTSKLVPWTVPELVGQLCDEYGFILVQPHGRGNTDFQGPGEVDVLRALEETAARYHVDLDRVHMAGNSMGGYGAYCIALHYPDRFASVAVACAQSDYFTWYGIDRAAVPTSKQYMYALSNPVDWMENALHLPILIQHGERDPLVPLWQSQVASERLSQLGYEHELYIVPNAYHQIYLDEGYFRRLMGFCLPRRRVARPGDIRLVTYSVDYGQAYWVRVTGIQRWGGRAEVSASAEPGRVTVTTQNVSGLELAPPRSLVGDGPVAVVVDGERTMWSGEGPLHWGRPVSPAAKRPGVCGPIRTVFNRPFVCIYGAGSAETESLLAGFTREWWSFAEGLPWVYGTPHRWSPRWAVADAEADEETLASRNLLLFGRPEENTVVARIAGQLPFRFIDGGYRVGDRDFVGDDLGMWFCYPSPFNPDRMILSISGHPWGAGFASAARTDHKFDLMPDFVLYDSLIDADGTNRFLAAGICGPDWEVQTLDLADGVEGEHHTGPWFGQPARGS